MKQKDYAKHVALPVLLYSAITGITVGTAVFFFKLIAEKLVDWSKSIYTYAQSNLWTIPLVVLGAVALALLMYFLQKWAPETKGGGIPRAEGVLRGVLTFRWLRTALAVVANSFISFFAGLPLGSEGPSVLLGTALAGGTSKLPLAGKSWERYVMTGGASAGFAVATNAPLTGILFSVEETHKRFSSSILLMAVSSVTFGIVASNLWTLVLGRQIEPLFGFAMNNGKQLFECFTMREIWVVLVIGIVVSVMACAYNKVIFLFGRLHDTTLAKVPNLIRLAVAFLIVAIIGLISIGTFNGTEVLYGGNELIVEVVQANKTLVILLVVLVLKFFTVAFSTSSGATGGVFVPMLSIGALTGGVLADVLVRLGMNADLYASVVIISMSCFMGACTRAPITAFVFVLESTWNYANTFFVGVAVVVSYFLCEAMHVEPLYDVLLGRMVDKQNQGKTSKLVKLEYAVMNQSFAVGRCVKDILLPANTKVSEIVVDGSYKLLDGDGERKMRVGDIVTLYAQTYNIEQTRMELNSIFGEQQ